VKINGFNFRANFVNEIKIRIKTLIKQIFFKAFRVEIRRVSPLAPQPNPTVFLSPILMKVAKRVLHIGAHTGQEREMYASFDLEVLWIEGDPDTYEILKNNLEAYPSQKSTYALLSDIPGMETQFYTMSNDGASSSLYRLDENQPFKVVETGVKILRTTNLDSVLLAEDNNFPYWVIDVQGAELLVLRGARESLKMCKYLELEVSTFNVYREQPLFSEIASFVDAAGFFPIWQPPQGFHGNVLFLRK